MNSLWKSYSTWFNQIGPGFAFTGSAKQCLQIPGKPDLKQWCSVHDLAKNTKFFVERLSRDVFGRKGVRNGQSVKYCGVIEGGPTSSTSTEKRFHVHLCLGGIPDSISQEDIRVAAVERWDASLWGYHETDFQKLLDETQSRAWTNYMFKTLDQTTTDRLITNVPFAN